MNCKVHLPPPETREQTIICDVSIVEKTISTNHKCDTCSSVSSCLIQSEITIDIRSNESCVSKEFIKTRIGSTIAKVYKERHRCDSKECIRIFNNETLLRFQRKPGFSSIRP